jgi:hypothetical protein
LDFGIYTGKIEKEKISDSTPKRGVIYPLFGVLSKNKYQGQRTDRKG